MAQDGSGSQRSLMVGAEADAERWTIGTVLVGGKPAAEEAINVGLRSQDFGLSKLRTVWAVIELLHERNDRIDLITVVDELQTRGELDAVGGSAAVAMMHANASGFVGAAGRHARVILDGANYRRLAEASHIFLTAANAREDTPAVLLAEAQDVFANLNRRAADDLGIVDRPKTVADVLARAGKAPEGSLPTGFTDVDHMLRGGLRPGSLYIVAARPAMGKSAFAHQVATYTADQGIPCALFSLEMTGEELIEREIAGAAKRSIESWRGRDAQARAVGAGAMVADRCLHLIDRAGLDLAGLTSRIRRLVRRDGVSIVFVDYLQLVGGSSRWSNSDNKNSEVGEISSALKVLAQDLRIPIVVLSQLNREVEKRPGKRPQLSDLRDSGNIEQDANVVIFLHRPEYFLGDQCPEDRRGVCEIIVAKNRSGATGAVDLFFDGPTTSFRQQREF